jgi:hypothetical protein
MGCCFVGSMGLIDSKQRVNLQMDVNPYESPHTAEEPTPLVPTKRPLWLGAIYLLATAGMLFFHCNCHGRHVE